MEETDSDSCDAWILMQSHRGADGERGKAGTIHAEKTSKLALKLNSDKPTWTEVIESKDGSRGSTETESWNEGGFDQVSQDSLDNTKPG